MMVYCKELQKDVNDKQCAECWKSGQKEVWAEQQYKRNFKRGDAQHLLRRDCRAEHTT